MLRSFKEDFPNVLTRLGVFHGGEENAFALFNKLDYDSRGYITVHELLNRCGLLANTVLYLEVFV